MKLMTMPSEFQKALPILNKIKEAGYEAYFVGGSVRDVLLGRPIHDVDIATSSYPEETKAILTELSMLALNMVQCSCLKMVVSMKSQPLGQKMSMWIIAVLVKCLLCAL